MKQQNFQPCTEVRLLASHQGEPGSNPDEVAPGFPRVGNRARQCHWSMSFLGDLPFPLPFIPALLHNHLASASSALKTSMLRAAQVSYTRKLPAILLRKPESLNQAAVRNVFCWATLRSDLPADCSGNYDVKKGTAVGGGRGGAATRLFIPHQSPLGNEGNRPQVNVGHDRTTDRGLSYSESGLRLRQVSGNSPPEGLATRVIHSNSDTVHSRLSQLIRRACVAVGLTSNLLRSCDMQPIMVQRDGRGAAAGMQGRGETGDRRENPADQRQRPERCSRGKIREQPRRESSPVRLVGQCAIGCSRARLTANVRAMRSLPDYDSRFFSRGDDRGQSDKSFLSITKCWYYYGGMELSAWRQLAKGGSDTSLSDATGEENFREISVSQLEVLILPNRGRAFLYAMSLASSKSKSCSEAKRKSCRNATYELHNGNNSTDESHQANRVQFLAGSPDLRKWKSWWSMPLVGGFSRGPPVSPTPSFRRRSAFTPITLILNPDNYIYGNNSGVCDGNSARTIEKNDPASRVVTCCEVLQVGTSGQSGVGEKLNVLRPLTRERRGAHYTRAVTSTQLLRLSDRLEGDNWASVLHEVVKHRVDQWLKSPTIRYSTEQNTAYLATVHHKPLVEKDREKEKAREKDKGVAESSEPAEVQRSRMSSTDGMQWCGYQGSVLYSTRINVKLSVHITIAEQKAKSSLVVVAEQVLYRRRTPLRLIQGKEVMLGDMHRRKRDWAAVASDWGDCLPKSTDPPFTCKTHTNILQRFSAYHIGNMMYIRVQNAACPMDRRLPICFWLQFVRIPFVVRSDGISACRKRSEMKIQLFEKCVIEPMRLAYEMTNTMAEVGEEMLNYVQGNIQRTGGGHWISDETPVRQNVVDPYCGQLVRLFPIIPLEQRYVALRRRRVRCAKFWRRDDREGKGTTTPSQTACSTDRSLHICETVKYSLSHRIASHRNASLYCGTSFPKGISRLLRYKNVAMQPCKIRNCGYRWPDMPISVSFCWRWPDEERCRAQSDDGLYRGVVVTYSAPINGRWRGVCATGLSQSRSCPGSIFEGVIRQAVQLRPDHIIILYVSRGAAVVKWSDHSRLSPKRTWFDSRGGVAPGFSQVGIVWDDAACKVWSGDEMKGRGKREIPEKYPPTNGIVRHVSQRRQSQVIEEDRRGIAHEDEEEGGGGWPGSEARERLGRHCNAHQVRHRLYVQRYELPCDVFVVLDVSIGTELGFRLALHCLERLRIK
ncbi:hypothetical protein PR048_000413 [Dryococelus australis]|uniref:Uncharacterized protein n=1 Tax=Dryococelus australis TaxID=614101 RepID=A0ABQ9IGU8_9NEOP|nr:hypothetical protein PR048_000413 [Dryococelus australis]